jgi:poly(A) polymerase
VTTHRAEEYDSRSRKPDVVFGHSPGGRPGPTGLHRQRHGLCLPDLELVDPFDGLADLAAQELRTPLDPEVSFTDDPLRMLRAARFIAKGTAFSPDPELVERPSPMPSDRLDIVSDERIRDELDKLVVVRTRRRACGSWSDRPGRRVPPRAARPWPSSRTRSTATRTCLAHTMAVVDKTRPTGCSPGRPLPRHRQAQDPGLRNGGTVTFPPPRGGRGPDDPRPHACAALPQADDIDDVTRLVELHLRFHTYRHGLDRQRRAPLRARRRPLLDQLNELTRCDCTTRNAAKARALGQRMDELEARIAELRQQEELDAIRPTSTAARSWRTSGWARAPRGPGPGLPARAPAGGGPPG